MNDGFIIYSKSGCINCVSVSKLLDSNFIDYKYVLCDDELLENRDQFLEKMRNYAGKEVKQFPMVFHNRLYIGGYQETMEFVNHSWGLFRVSTPIPHI